MPANPSFPRVLFGHYFHADEQVPLHHHECPELVLITHGKCQMHVGPLLLSGKRGDMFLLPPRIQHDQVSSGVVGTLYIGFVPGDDPLPPMPQVIPTAGDGYVRPWVQAAIDLHRKPDTPPALVGGIMTALLARLRYLHGRLANPTVKHPKVDAVLDYIRQHLGETLSVAKTCHSAGVSPSHLRTLFRQHVGLSPVQYQKSLRMGVALQRLADPYPSIKEIAAECGYRDVNLFIRLFRKQHGSSPGRWRTQNVGRR